MASINADIYKINEFVDDIKKKFIEVENEETLAMGMYGYQGEVFSRLIQNSIIVGTEFVNEAIPTRARFDSNVIAHAMSYGANSINATPSQIEVLIGFKESDITPLIKNEKFIIDKDIKFYIGDFEFHIDYDIELKRIKPSEGSYIYIAQYNIDRDNSLSDIRFGGNSYLDSPILVNEKNGDRTIFIRTKLRQVEFLTINTKILSSSVLENKIFTFDFTGQLSTFEVKVLNGSDEPKYLTPVFEGVLPDNIEDYCYYSYLNSNTIRVRFDMNSYVPALNNEVQVLLKTTQGASGNFTYSNNIIQAMGSTDKMNYNNIPIVISPISSALYGNNRKTIEEIRKMIPKEIISRGSITTTTDLNNYFNVIDNDNNKLTFEKKRENVLERKYYTYMLLKDMYDNIVPTNTINLQIPESELPVSADGRIIIPSGTMFPSFYNEQGNSNCIVPSNLKVYNLNLTSNAIENSIKENPNFIIDKIRQLDSEITDFNGCLLIDNNTTIKMPNNIWECVSYTPATDTENETSEWVKIGSESEFKYTCPFTICINPLNKVISYYLTAMKKSLYLNFIEVNDNSQNQFIIPSINWERKFGENKYNIKFEFSPNIPVEGNNKKVYVLFVLYGEDNKPIAYIDSPANPNYNVITGTYMFNESIMTDNIINMNINNKAGVNLLHGDGYKLKALNDNKEIYGLDKTKCKIFTFIVDQSVSTAGTTAGQYIDENNVLIHDFKYNYTLTNKYEVDSGLSFFSNYTSKIGSKYVKDNEHSLTLIKSVPVVRYDYMYDVDRDNSSYLIDTLETKRNYMENALKILEDSFEFDFKFYNTYGVSKLFRLDGEILNKTNINLTFEVKLKESADDNIISSLKQEIKSYIENLNNSGNIHISNLIYYITNKFQESIYYIEFVRINEYDTNKQYLEKIESESIDDVPEFLNIDVNNNYGPMIKITIV